MSFMTRRRALFAAVLTALIVVVAFAVTRFARILPVGVEVSVTDEPAPKPKEGPVSISVTRVPLGGNPDGDDEAADETPAGQLVAAATAGDIMRVGALLDEGVPPDAQSRGFPAIHRAAQANSLAVLELLVAAGADLEALDRSGHTALARAALFGRAGAVSFLLESGADPNAHAEPNNQTPLLGLLFGWSLGQSPNPLGIEADEEERLTAARALLAAGADPQLAPGMISPAMMAESIGGEIRSLLVGGASDTPPRSR
ncbi:MAG: ankyrin repeat domain-containing protein [Acidobacteria bacterium]|nr:ankyrin repeat domain-containing protein [Acidobacteriota bacterium]MYE42767.1 ankyrin repeat domain-containing protein [Acidobacteriota bacterium]